MKLVFDIETNGLIKNTEEHIIDEATIFGYPRNQVVVCYNKFKPDQD